MSCGRISYPRNTLGTRYVRDTCIVYEYNLFLVGVFSVLFLFCFLFWHRISCFFSLSLFSLFFPRRIYNSVILNLKLVSVCCAFFLCGLSRLCHYFHDVKLKQTRLSGDDGRFMLCKCSTYCSSFLIGAFWKHFETFSTIRIYTCILHKTRIDCGKFLVSNLNDIFFSIFRYDT